MSRTGAGSTTRTASSATATTWPATACSCTAWTRSRPTLPMAIRSRIFRETFLFWRASKGGPGLPEEGGPLGFGDACLGKDPEGRRHLGCRSSFSTISRARGLAPVRRTTRDDQSPESRCVKRVTVRLVLLYRADDGPGGNTAARAGSRIGTDAQRESGRRSTRNTARNATARRGTVTVMPPRTCSPGPATSRPASSRFGRLRTERSRPIRSSSTSSGAACPTPRCPPGPTCPNRKCRSSRTTSRPSLQISRRRECPEAHGVPSAPAATTDHQAREETLRGERLLEVPRQARTGRRTVGANAGGRLGRPIRAADLTQSWTFRGGPTREDIFRTMTTGLNGRRCPRSPKP